MRKTTFKYYEDGHEKTYTMRDVYRQFTVLVPTEQKEQGTTFTSWLSEMEHLQILIRVAQKTIIQSIKREVKAVGKFADSQRLFSCNQQQNIASHWNFTTLAERLKEVKDYEEENIYRKISKI